MTIGIYDAPDGERGWSGLKLGDLCDALEFEYEKQFCGAGTFTLVIPRNSTFADKIYVGCFLIKRAEGAADEYEGFVVKNILRENDTIKITGYDLNGLLLDRITLYPEGEEKDIQSGFTESIVKHYVEFNCTASSDEERNFPSLGIAEDKHRGIPDDAASPRLQCLADVIADILGAQNMGYRIYPFMNGGRDLLFFEVYEAVDRTQNQSENSRVVLSFGRGNIAEMKREEGVTADKNTFYCEIDDGAVQRYYKKTDEETESDGENAANVGYDRREEYLKLGCELGELVVYAEHEIADRYRETDSLTITAGNPLDFGSVYNVGDIVTVYDRERRLQLDSVISAAEIKRTGTEYSVKIILGESKPKVLDNYQKKNSATATAVRNNTNSGGVGRPSEWDKTSEYFNFYDNRDRGNDTSPKNVAGTQGQTCYAHSEGYNAKATGRYSHAEGLNNTASGESSHAEGMNNSVSGQYSHAEGMGNTQSGNSMCVHLEGYNHTVSSNGSSYVHVEGSTNTASGFAVHVEGQQNTGSESNYAHVEGFYNNVTGSQEGHCEGMSNTVLGANCGHAEGMSNRITSCADGHAEGQNNELSGGLNNHAEGYNNKVTDSYYSHAEGQGNTMEGCSGSHVSGSGNVLQVSSFADVSGMNNTVSGGAGNSVHGLGLEVTGGSMPVFCVGQYNAPSENGKMLLFCVGSGTDTTERKNAFAVDSDGNLYITGDIYINGKKLDIGGTNE